MFETSARLLRVLSLLQSGRTWTGADLARRLSVTDRTLRTDVARLRTLGYPIDATPGVAGGYRLGTGGRLPPLLLDDEEAVAVAVGLRSATSGVVGAEEAALRALAKLEQLLPARLHQRVSTLYGATAAVPAAGPPVGAEVLTTLAGVVRSHERLRFDYTTHDGGTTVREVEPHRLVNMRGRWYMVAWDCDVGAWRTFRADRLEPRLPTGPRFAPRDPPDGDAVEFVRRAVETAPWHTRARLRLHAPAAQVRPRLPTVVDVRPDGPGTCVVDVGADTPEVLALHVGLLGVDFEVLDGAELAAHLVSFAERLQRAAGTPAEPTRA
jgi:predicted DNA-binding transcriptional regulator YafY